MERAETKLHWRYRLLETIGQGGFGKVFLVRDSISGRKLILKTTDASGRACLKNEFIRLHRFRHPGLPAVYDFHQTAESASLSQEYCPGILLSERISQGPLPEGEALKLLNRLAVILDFIHQRGFIHGDLKPENIVLNSAAVKLLDLGLARKAGSSLDGITAGTPAYVSPELIAGQGVITQASDMFSLGLLLLEMLSGKLPPPEKRFNSNEPLMADIKKMISGPGADILLKMLRHDPIERLGSAGELLALGREAGIFPEQEDNGKFDYIAPHHDLRAVISRCQKSSPLTINITGERGSGKTGFLKEINFINQLQGRPSYYIDAESSSGTDLSRLEFEPGSVILADNAGGSPDMLYELARDKKCSIIFAAPDHHLPGPGAVDCFALSPASEQIYQRALRGHFKGINQYDLRLLAGWLIRQTGDSIGRGEKLVGCLTGKGLVRQRHGIWHVKWSEILKGRHQPQDTTDQLEAWWQTLSPDERRMAINISLGQVPSDQDPGIGLGCKIMKGDGRWAVRDEQVLSLVSGKWGKEEYREFIKALTALKDLNGQFFCRDAYRSLLAEKEDWENWAWVMLQLYKKAEAAQDCYATLFLARDLVDSGKLEKNPHQELAAKITDAYCQLGQWENALEAWVKLEKDLKDDLKYWKRFFYVSITGRFLDIAEDKIGEIIRGGISENEAVVMAAGVYGGYLKAVKEDPVLGQKAIQYCISQNNRKENDWLVKLGYELMAQLAYQKGRWEEVVDYLGRSRQYPRGDDGYDSMRSDFVYGIALWMTSNLTKARDVITEAISRGDSQTPSQRLAKIYCSLGTILFEIKDWKGAVESYQKSVYHALATSEMNSLASSRYGLANISMKQGRFVAAYNIYYELYHQSKGDTETGGPIGFLTTLGILENMLGRKELALERIDKAIEANRRHKVHYPEEMILKARAGVELEQGKYRPALATFARALAAYRDQATMPDAEIYADMAYAEFKAGSAEKGRAWLKAAKDAPDKNLVLVSRIKAVEGMMNMTDEISRLEGARISLMAGKEMLESGDRFYAASCWLQTAEEAVKYEDSELLREIMPWLIKAESEFIVMGTPDYLERVRETIVKAARKYFSQPGKVKVPAELLNGVYQLAGTLSTEGSQSAIARSALKLAVEMAGAERGALFLLDERSKINLAAQIDLDDQTKIDALEFSTSAVLNAGQGEVIISNDASVDEAFISRLSVQRNVIRSLLCVPIRFREGAAGAIYLDSRITSGLFGREQKEFVLALAGIIGAVLESNKLITRLKSSQAGPKSPAEDISSLVIGQSVPMKQMIDRIRAIAKADINVLLQGESGSGKEVMAQAIHSLSARRGQKFLALDCGALPETLLESELFGYVKGAFTGANKDKTGLFESADGGTVFLDEIASASQAVQPRLLRVLESGEIRRVGDSASRTVDVRVICATNRDLEIEINEGRFRSDLYYRLKVVTIPIPPLRERGSDILLLAEYFKDKYQKKFGKIGLRFDSEAKHQMMNYSWPGNVRELENTIQKAVLLANAKTISREELEISSDMAAIKNRIQIDQGQEISEALKNFKGNITLAAKAVGISRRHFYRLIEKHKIKAAQEKL
jgi:Nif-specific regulatory protein